MKEKKILTQKIQHSCNYCESQPLINKALCPFFISEQIISPQLEATENNKRVF